MDRAVVGDAAGVEKGRRRVEMWRAGLYEGETTTLGWTSLFLGGGRAHGWQASSTEEARDAVYQQRRRNEPAQERGGRVEVREARGGR
jgi:hypothetical protein